MSSQSPPTSTDLPEVLARGPWPLEQVRAHWREEHFEPSAAHARAADAAIAALQQRGSPSHDGVAARLVEYARGRGRRRAGAAAAALGACGWSPATRRTASRRTASRVRPTAAGWPAGARRGSPRGPGAGRWARAARSISARTRPTRSCASSQEEWSVAPARVQGEALLRLPHKMVMFIGQAWLAEGAEDEVTPDHEHDAFAWWPREIDEWPPEAGEILPRLARWLTQ